MESPTGTSLADQSPTPAGSTPEGPTDAGPESARPGPQPARPDPQPARPDPQPPAGARPALERLAVEVLAVHPHDREAYTQGLLWHQGHMYESTGQEGRSSLRQVELTTGRILRRHDLSPRHFGEGLARVGERLIQLTWMNEQAFVYDLATFEGVAEHSYPGQGWGLCSDGERLVMSDGSSVLTFRHPETFAVLGRVAVHLEGRPLAQLNELECAGGEIYANVYTTDTLVRIDPGSGAVRAVIDASGLLEPAEAAAAEVLNGIAYRPETGTFLLTGKLWPRLFEVRFRPAGQ